LSTVGSAWGFGVAHPGTMIIAAAIDAARTKRAVPVDFIVRRAT
jgi:hypothetical protein